MKNSILLAIGLIVTAAAIALSDTLFEALYFDNEFSNEMYNNHLYFTNILIVAITAWGLAAIYYYIINSVSFSRWYHWLMVLAAAVIICPIASYFHITGTMEEMQLNFEHQAFHFVLTEAFVEAAMFVIASFSIRWWSSNCRHTPFPE